MTDITVLPPEDYDKQPHLPALNINQLISQAIQSNLSVDALERLLAISRELKADAAKEAFDAAMTAFQGECPQIRKIKPGGATNEGVVAYHYAPIEELDTQTKALRVKYGFSYIIHTETLEKSVKATCIVKHIAGHEVSTTFQVPVGAGTRVMSNSQIVAAAFTFATRYAFRNAFGLITSDDDNEDLLRQHNDMPTPTELATLMDLVEASGFSAEAIAKKFKVTNLTDIKRSTCLYITNKLTDALNTHN